jgi:hypothetical protein
MPKPNAFVKIKTLVKWLQSLTQNLRGGSGWNSASVGDSISLSRGPRYFFAGQMRQVSGGVDVLPFWVESGQDERRRLIGLEGFVSCPLDGVVCLIVYHQINFELNDGLLGTRIELTGAELAGGSNIPQGVTATAELVRTEEDVFLVSQTNISVTIVPLATVSGDGFVTHVVSNPAATAPGVAIKSVLPVVKINIEEPEPEPDPDPDPDPDPEPDPDT